ncbi:CDP-alcohol phosphatidyltransferase family protein, partial [bacterium]|nr:CDP-alcohol phosphatidyltransferase family protein [bacterium]
MEKTKDKDRVNDILLGPLERPALLWLSERMPAWVTPDILTVIGIVAALIIAGSYYLSNFDKNFLWLANFGFVLNWFGDSLDGSVARYRHIERPKYGYFVDHAVDAFTSTVICVGLGL